MDDLFEDLNQLVGARLAQIAVADVDRRIFKAPTPLAKAIDGQRPVPVRRFGAVHLKE